MLTERLCLTLFSGQTFKFDPHNDLHPNSTVLGVAAFVRLEHASFWVFEDQVSVKEWRRLCRAIIRNKDRNKDLNKTRPQMETSN